MPKIEENNKYIYIKVTKDEDKSASQKIVEHRIVTLENPKGFSWYGKGYPPQNIKRMKMLIRKYGKLIAIIVLKKHDGVNRIYYTAEIMDVINQKFPNDDWRPKYSFKFSHHLWFKISNIRDVDKDDRFYRPENFQLDNNKLLSEIIKFKPTFCYVKYVGNIKYYSKGDNMNDDVNEPNITVREGLVNTRVGQGKYRKKLLRRWGNKCAVTGCKIPEILIASHIFPWRISNDKERTDINNGILLSPNYDALFDKYLISFDDDGKIIISDKISEESLQNLKISREAKIDELSDGNFYYLKKHRKVFFTLNKL